MAAWQTTEQPAELMRRSLIHWTQQLDREGPPANDLTEPNFWRIQKICKVAQTFLSSTKIRDINNESMSIKKCIDLNQLVTID